jgi:hypothetical protein
MRLLFIPRGAMPMSISKIQNGERLIYRCRPSLRAGAAKCAAPAQRFYCQPRTMR